MRSVLGCCLALLTATPLLAQQARTTPDLIVFIAVDQLRQDYLDRFASQLEGGLARLMRTGAFYTNGFQDHAVTETAVGHASMLSGRFPRSTGIISNALGVPDPQVKLINGSAGASPFRFRGGTLIDWMRTRDPLSRALSVSVKDRSAILPLGRAKQQVFWYANDGSFTTSTYYADTLPTWVQQFNARQLPQKYAGREWRPLLNPSDYPEPDSVPAEAGGRRYTFPHVVSQDVASAVRELSNFPWIDQINLELALAGVDALKLGKNGHIDLLSISLSATDIIGHTYGPDSRELHDQILRLDRALGSFIDSLYTRFRPEQLVFALTADHGVTPFPEVRASSAEAAKAMHVSIEPALLAVRSELERLDVERTAVSFQSGMLVLNERAFAGKTGGTESVARVFATKAAQILGVLRVDWVSELAQGDTINDPYTRRWHHMIPRDLPIPVVVTLEPGHVWGNPRSATHGSPHDADAHVPIIFMGPQFKPGRYDQFARTADIAPTLAHILDVQPTEPVDGRILRTALRAATGASREDN